MIKISAVVKKIVLNDEIALNTMSSGILNLSAYATTIKHQVEQQTKKKLKIGSIIVSLSRLAAELTQQPPLLPPVHINTIAAKSGLIEIAYDKTPYSIKQLTAIYHTSSQTATNNFCTITEGVSEISLITSAANTIKLQKLTHQKPKIVLKHLAALTISFDQAYITTPNTTYAFIRYLAIKRINIIETISTYTELTFILSETDLKQAFDIMSQLLQ